MSTTINILLKGLAVCFRENADLKVIFLCDDRHRLKFSYRVKDEVSSKEVELRRKNREIYFDVNNAQTPAQPNGDGYKQIFNINSLYAHRGKIKLKPLKEVSAKRDVVTMVVQNAQLSMAEPQPTGFPSEKPYHIMVKGEPDTETPIHVAARVVRAKITLNSGGSLQIKGRDADFPLIEHCPYKEGIEYDLTFDNDCGDECGEEDDFREYYDLLYDESGLQFIAGRPPLFVGSSDKLLTPDGNCDPINIDPPPG